MISIDLIIIIAFLAITLLLGLIHGRKVKTFRDYALGSGMSVFVLTCSLVATLSEGQTLNMISIGYSGGFPFFFNLVILVSMIYFGAKVFMVRMAEFFGDFSIAESMGKLYGPIARKMAALSILVLLLCALVTQLKVALELISFALPDLPSNVGNWVAVVTGVIIIIYAALGGAKSVAMTDVFQFLCFGCVFPLIGYLLLRHAKIPLADGWVHFKQLPQFTDMDYIFSLQVLKNKALFAVSALFSVVSPLVMQRFYMAKSVQQGQKVVVVSVAARAYVFGSLVCLTLLLHLGGHTLKPEENVVGYMISLVQHSPAIRGILGATVLALLMSTVDSALHLFAVVVVNDLLPPSLFVNKSGEKKKLQISRLLIVVIGIITLCGTLVYEGDVYRLMNKGIDTYIPMVGVPFVMALLGFRPRRAVVLAAMVVGGTYGAYASYHDFPSIMGEVFMSVAISVCTLMLGHYCSPLLPHTGWVGIKDSSAVELQSQETQRWWMQQWYNFKMLFTRQYRAGLFPKKESAFIILGVYLIVSALLALCFMQKDYFTSYVYWYMAVMAIGTILIIYPSFDMYKKESHFVYFVWLSLLFMLFFVSSIQFAKLGNFGPMVCALLVCNLAASTLFFSLKVSMGMFVLAMMVHKLMLPSIPLGSTYCMLLEQRPFWEFMAATLLVGLSIAGFGTYKYCRDQAEVKARAIELARTYERRVSLEAIYNQVNWHRLDPTHGSKMLQEMSKMLEASCQYLYTNGQEKLGEDINSFMKKLREFSSVLLQRVKEERSLKLNKNVVRPTPIASIVHKAYNNIRSLGEPLQLLLRHQTIITEMEVDPNLFERLLAINFLAISKSEQSPDQLVALTISEASLGYDYAKSTQLGQPTFSLPALAFCMSTHSSQLEEIPYWYDVTDEATPVFLPKTESQLYQAESRQIVEAHGGYVEITETKDRLTCLYVLPISGSNVMHFKTYDPAALASEVAETPASLAQEKELVQLLTTATTLTKDIVEETIAFIKNAHGLVKRKSGEPYYTHPMEVAKILLDVTKDPDTILAGLLHDVVEDTPVTLSQIQLMYGPQVAYIVDMVTHYNTNGYRWKLNDDENRSMLYHCSDIRVVHVKLADRLHNTRTLSFRKPVDQKRIARETITFYIPWGNGNNIPVWLDEMQQICEEILRKKGSEAVSE